MNVPSDTLVNDILTEYNAGIPQLVEKLRSEGKHVSTVDMWDTVISDDELSEGGSVPRSVVGERMAQVWLEQIMEILGKPVRVSSSPTLEPSPTQAPPPPPKFYVDTPLRIMPLGDGLIEGWCDKSTNCIWPEENDAELCATSWNTANPGEKGFREFLRNKLVAAGVNMTYVGSVEVIPDLAHEGHVLFTIPDLEFCILNAKWLEQANPDMVLLATGGVDLVYGDPPKQVIEKLEGLLTRIYQELPATTEVILAQLPGAREKSHVNLDASQPLFNDVMAEYNSGISGVVQAFRADGKHVTLVDLRDTIQSTDDFDETGFQPNVVASERIAQIWFEKIMEIVLQPNPAATSTPDTQAQAGESLLIMPLGDSITEGVCDQPDTCNVPEIKTPGTGYGLESCSFNLNVYNPAARGYREFLRDKLIEAGVDITYVGSVQVNEGLAHEGHSAFRTSDIDYCIQNADWLEQAKPDMILLHVGSADAGDGGIPANTSLVALRDILTHIYQISPETTEVILAQVIPAREDSHVNFDPSEPLVNEILAEYNAGIPAVVEEFRAMGKHVSLVDMREAIQSADDYDEMGRHPNAIASERIAQIWFEKIMEILEE